VKEACRRYFKIKSPSTFDAVVLEHGLDTACFEPPSARETEAGLIGGQRWMIIGVVDLDVANVCELSWRTVEMDTTSRTLRD
jgi:hypothetical protein